MLYMLCGFINHTFHLDKWLRSLVEGMLKNTRTSLYKDSICTPNVHHLYTMLKAAFYNSRKVTTQNVHQQVNG